MNYHDLNIGGVTLIIVVITNNLFFYHHVSTFTFQTIPTRINSLGSLYIKKHCLISTFITSIQLCALTASVLLTSLSLITALIDVQTIS